MKIIRQYGDTNFITGLRAVAATMVVVIHTGAFSQLGTIGENITANGKYGVQMFFVISGFTIAATFIGNERYISYFVRRVLRIAPLYWLACILMALLYHLAILQPNYWMQRLGTESDVYNLAMHLSFLSFLDYRLAPSLIGTEWTIPIEMFWYALLPLLITRCTSVRRRIFALGLLLLVAGLTRLVAALIGTSLIAQWFPTTYGPYFLIGVFCFFLRNENRFAHWQFRRLALFAAFAVFLGAITADIGGGAIVGMSTAALITLYKPGENLGLLESRPMLFIGSISYSIYLWHAIVIMFFSAWGIQSSITSSLSWFGAVYIATLALSIGTYLLIEIPTNRLGKRIADDLLTSSNRQKLTLPTIK